MQRNCTELTERLLNSLDKEYNVVDMGAVVDVITALETTTITKEVLEITRLGKHINELRKKTTNYALAKRAKDLVRRWRDMVLPSTSQQPSVTSNTPIAPSIAINDNISSHQTLNGTNPASPLITAARTIRPRSPVPGSSASRINPQSPLMRDAITSKIISPALSLNSDSRSPNSTPLKLPIVTTNYKLNTAGSPKLSGTSNQNHSIEAVPRTHSSNKRLRKEDNIQQQQQVNSPQQYDVNSTFRNELTSISIHAAKKQRINGDINVNTNSQVPNSPSSSSSTRNELNVNPVLDSSLSSNTNLASTAAVKVEPVPVPVGPKKRGRKKGSKSIKSQSLSEDRVKEKLASISRNPKLKTTHEILADIQVRNVSGVLGATTASQLKREPPTTEEVLRSSEINNRNLASNNNTRTKNLSGNRFESRLPAGNTATDVAGSGINNVVADAADRIKAERASEPEAPSIDATVKEILSKLPPLDINAITWSDDELNHDHSHDGDEECKNNNAGTDQPKYRQINDDAVERLHNECIESLNGNFQVKLTTNSVKKDVVDDIDESVNKKMIGVYKRRVVDDDTEHEFREWHEMLAKPSYDGQILHILPYVIID